MRVKIRAAHPQDAYTKAHYDDLLQQIKLAFEGGAKASSSSAASTSAPR